MNWTTTCTNHFKELGFTVGEYSPCNLYHREREISVTVYGDDFTSTGRESDLRWMDAQLKSEFEVKTKVRGQNPHRHVQEVMVLNRIITWTNDGIKYEPDPRHAELVVKDLGLEGGKRGMTPGSKDEVTKALQQHVDDNWRDKMPSLRARCERQLSSVKTTDKHQHFVDYVPGSIISPKTGRI